MVRLKLAQLMKDRDVNGYRLAKATGLTEPRVYRLAAEDGTFERLEADALNALCEYFRVQPGDLIEWVPDKKRRK
jgi:DNA-binding Xre family transcriptional regulator